MPRQTVKDLNIKVDEVYSRLDSKIDALKTQNVVSSADPDLNLKIVGIQKEIKGLTARLNIQSRTVSKVRGIVDEMRTPVETVGKNEMPTEIPWRTRVWTNTKNRINSLRKK